MREKHTEQVQSAKKSSTQKMTTALQKTKAVCLNDVSNILEEVLSSITKKQESRTNQSNNEEPFVNTVNDVGDPSPKSTVDPNDDWLVHTNTDLGLMLECAQLTLALQQ